MKMNEFTEKMKDREMHYECSFDREPNKKWSIKLRMDPRGFFVDFAPTLGKARNKARELICEWDRVY